jgi:ornithine decarboxylase
MPRGPGDLPMTYRIDRFLEEQAPQTPCLVIDLDVVEQNYEDLAEALPLARIFYAVKANPAPALLERLVALGSSFDVASPGEIDLVLAAGASPDRISYGNTIKKQRDIAYAYQRGIRLFAFDSEAELDKLAIAAPGASVFCRVLVDCGGAEWPLSRKFGCSEDMAVKLLAEARRRGLDACGFSFHVGSQQTRLKQWDAAVGSVARLFRRLRDDGVEPRLVNMGGGFPATYRTEVPPIRDYADAIMAALTRHFGNDLPEIIIEPGRSLAGNAGVIEAEVVLISRKDDSERDRWVYLDIGKFGGLAETMDESIKYPITTPRDGGVVGPVVLAGPTCDSADILYEKAPYLMPLDLEIGDKVKILGTGAYTSTYSSVSFNGFAPLKTYCI